MQQASAVPPARGIGQGLATGVGRVVVSIFVPIMAFIVLWAGFMFLRDSGAPKLVIVAVAIVWGIGGVALLYVVANWMTEKLPPAWQRRIIPFVFVGPAMAILAFYLLVPAVLTFWGSLFGANGKRLRRRRQLRLLVHEPRDGDRDPQQRAVARVRDRVQHRRSAWPSRCWWSGRGSTASRRR